MKGADSSPSANDEEAGPLMCAMLIRRRRTIKRMGKTDSMAHNVLEVAPIMKQLTARGVGLDYLNVGRSSRCGGRTHILRQLSRRCSHQQAPMYTVAIAQEAADRSRGTLPLQSIPMLVPCGRTKCFARLRQLLLAIESGIWAL